MYGKEKQENVLIDDPAGQVHLTATGTTILIEEILKQQLLPKVYFGEMIMDSDHVLKRLKEENVLLDFNA